MVQLFFFPDQKLMIVSISGLLCLLFWTISVTSSLVHQPVSLPLPLLSVLPPALWIVVLSSVLDFLAGCPRGENFPLSF